MPANRKPAAKASSKTTAARKTTTRRRTTAKPKVMPEVPETRGALVASIPPQTSEEQRQAKLTAYMALKSAGVAIPAELSVEVEGWIEEENQRRAAEATIAAEAQAALDEENAKGPWFVRNGYGAEFNLRLDRQTEKRRISLKPRGRPGDMHPLEEGDLKDPNLMRNVQLGVIEIIPGGEAYRIMSQQTHNMGTRVHTPTALLRNPKGEAYAPDAIKVQAEFNSQGVTVATLDPNQMQGHVSDKEVASNRSFGGMQRIQPGQVPHMVSEFVPTGGNPAIIQSGPLQAPMGGLPGTGTNNAQAKIADDLARRRGLQGPQAGLGGLQVVVGPTVKE